MDENYIQHLLQVPEVARLQIILSIKDFEDVVALKNVNSELRDWMRRENIVQKWERKNLGKNDYWRSALLQRFAFEPFITLVIGKERFRIWFMENNPKFQCWFKLEQNSKSTLSMAANEFFQITHTGDDVRVPSTVAVFENIQGSREANDYFHLYANLSNKFKKTMFQFCILLMKKYNGRISGGILASNGNRAIRSCIGCNSSKVEYVELETNNMFCSHKCQDLYYKQ